MTEVTCIENLVVDVIGKAIDRLPEHGQEELKEGKRREMSRKKDHRAVCE